MNELATEREVLRLCANGDRDAYAFLYTRYLPVLSRYLYLFNRSKEDNEEIIQEVYLRIWENKEALREVQSFRAYLFRVAKNLLLDSLRRQQTELRILKLIAPASEDCYQRADDDLCYEQYQEVAREAIGKLTAKRRQIFELRTQEGLSLDEISGKLNISKNVVKKQFYTASDFVKTYLRNHGEMTLGWLVVLGIRC